MLPSQWSEHAKTQLLPCPSSILSTTDMYDGFIIKLYCCYNCNKVNSTSTARTIWLTLSLRQMLLVKTPLNWFLNVEGWYFDCGDYQKASLAESWCRKCCYPLQDNAQFGDHIWFETSGSGDFCYVGEQYCIAKSLVSHCAPYAQTLYCRSGVEHFHFV